ncbi:uncharacterized protein LOC126322529 isoform X2 [Schistocerca gregaria]|uniref:uncharacterized protein LOC126322529 isoform X2 n=1 Tax=Schistocerca gregaria TaxID=7010 RepID=UPI00211EAF08|nr:uncharacterized protein LOC126322529 isoform X2 [Schistocerca gregaria]
MRHQLGVSFSFSELQERSAQNVAMVVIRYLQSLPEPIYTKKYEAHVKLALNIADRQERIYVLRSILYKLPLANRETIRILIDHLRRVVAHSHLNRMTVRNLEITWSLSIGQSTGALIKVLTESDFSLPSTLQFFVPFDVALRNSCLSLSDDKSIIVPITVSTCVNWLLRHKSYKKRRLIASRANFKTVSSLMHAFNSGQFDLPSDVQDRKVAMLLQCWVQSLPEYDGLLPESVVRDLGHLPPIDECNSDFQEIILKLPESNLETIKVLVSFLHKIIQEYRQRLNEKKLCSKFFNTKHPGLLSLYTVLVREYCEIFEGRADEDSTEKSESVRTSDVSQQPLSNLSILDQEVGSSHPLEPDQPSNAEERESAININLAIESIESEKQRPRCSSDPSGDHSTRKGRQKKKNRRRIRSERRRRLRGNK